MNTRTVVFTALAVTLLGSLYLVYSPSLSDFSMPGSDSMASQGVPGLEFTLSQISKSPPSLLVTLKNNNPSSTYTILKWNTPLDPHAANLGVFKLVDAETGKELKTDVLMLRRKMPISQDDLQEIAPGTEHATEIVFSQPWMPETPGKYKVRVEGVFRGVWEKAVGDVKENELAAYTESPYNNFPFASEEELLIVE
ncbi:hypothetical protein K505DRAFT_321222 [Melanomma pulvis-pyrius CBS 109.77]|uniref:Uncharacterized protein n=1 Tax=Melanomma pulvis-pyrius CBS 109.77 TaxID=1314802 RepID=A0A6A6XUB1_9PLEO|nr:hypothetical protein K505DRAFT_321222 [Melanomma pulvis-pyrius CBS 109.77]